MTEIPPSHPFRCFVLNPDNSKATYVGGSYDNISAVTIACAVFQARQGSSAGSDSDLRICVFDDADTAIAFIGVEENVPVETPPPPTLTSLEPDSSGDWDAEVILHGTGFTASSEVYAGDAKIDPTTFVSDIELRATALASASGVYQVTVRNGSEVSNALDFTAL